MLPVWSLPIHVGRCCSRAVTGHLGRGWRSALAALLCVSEVRRAREHTPAVASGTRDRRLQISVSRRRAYGPLPCPVLVSSFRLSAVGGCIARRSCPKRPSACGVETHPGRWPGERSRRARGCCTDKFTGACACMGSCRVPSVFGGDAQDWTRGRQSVSHRGRAQDDRNGVR